MVLRIVSGAQSGADRGGLDAALELGLEHGGYVPRGRRAEDGVVPARFQMVETVSDAYDERTRLNVRHSDGTVVFSHGRPTGGSADTVRYAFHLGRPCLQLDPRNQDAASALHEWLGANAIEVLNVAGSRASKAPSLAREVQAVVVTALDGSLSALSRGVGHLEEQHAAPDEQDDDGQDA